MLLETKVRVLLELEEAISHNKKNVYNKRSPKGYGWSHFANKPFQPGETVVVGFGRIIEHQTGHCSIQIHNSTHIFPTKYTGRYWNHSCNPNCCVRTRNDGMPTLVALREISVNEEITFGYHMTEFSWKKDADENHIECLCGDEKCTGHIRSFSELTQPEKEMAYQSKQLSEYLELKFIENR